MCFTFPSDCRLKNFMDSSYGPFIHSRFSRELLHSQNVKQCSPEAPNCFLHQLTVVPAWESYQCVMKHSSINWQLFLLEKVINVSWNIFVRLSYCVEGQWDQGIWERQMLSIITKTTRSLYCYNIRRLYWNNNIWVPQHIIYRTTFAYHNTTIIELHLRTIKRQLSNYI